EADRVQAEVPADRGALEGGAGQELRRVERAGGNDDGAGADGAARAVRVRVLDARRATVLDQHALDGGVRAQLERAAGERVRDVRVHRRLAGVRRTALE